MSNGPISAPAGAGNSRYVALVIFFLSLFSTAALAQHASAGAGTKVRLAEPRLLTPAYVAGGAVTPLLSSAHALPPAQSDNARPQAATPAQILSSGQANALSLISADFNGDGIADLAAGYAAPDGGLIALHYTSLDALAPQSDAAFQAIGRGEFPEPFLRESPVFSVPSAPDLLAVGNFTGSGNNDLAVATRGAGVIYLLPGDGRGNFGTPETVPLAGKITALAAGRLGRTSLFSDLLIGISASGSSSLLVYRGASKGPKLLASYRLQKPVSSIAFGNLTGGAGADAAVAANGDLFILSSSTLQLEKVALPVAATAVTLGSFVYDRDGRLQMAVLSPDGVLHIVVRVGIDSRPLTTAERAEIFLAAAHGLPNPVVHPSNQDAGWKVVESFVLTAPGPSPLLFRTRISSNAADDVMIVNNFTGQMAVISHPNVPEGALTFSRGVVSVLPYAASPVATLSMHLNVGGRAGVVALYPGDSAPSVMLVSPDRVFSVNTTSDIVVARACANNVANSCSLREAILEANADNANDIVNVPAGTYTLTLSGPNQETAGATAAHGSLDIFHPLTINGAVDSSGGPATIIQAGSDSTNGIDRVFAVNPNADPGFDTYLSNLVVRFGRNTAGISGGSAGAIPRGFGGGLFWEGSQTGTMSLVNSIITGNSTLDGNGGGIAADNAAGGATGAGTGALTLIRSTVQNNSAQQSSTGAAGVGGGIWVTSGTPVVISGSQILDNQAAQGGGILLMHPGNNNTQSAIHGTMISGNKASGHGGGIFTGQGLIIDNAGAPAEISNNQGDQGGGLWSGPSNETTTLSKVTITENTATGSDAANCADSCGGGVFAAGTGADTSHLVMHFSRLAGNTAASGSNLANLGTAGSTDDVTDNWWGLNLPADTIHDVNGAVTFDPLIVFTHTANPAKIGTHHNSTLTGDMSSDNHGSSDALSGNLDVFATLPVSFHNSILGTISMADSGAPSLATTTTATFNAGNTGGKGSVDATVDQQTVTANITVTPNDPTAIPPTISKLFLPDTIAVNTTTLLSFAITNPNSDPNPAVSLTGIAFTDALPVGLQIASPNLLSSDCGGTVTATPGSSSISLTGGTIDPAVPLRPVSLRPAPFWARQSSSVRPALPLPFSATGACFISVQVEATSAGVFTNTTGTISANESGPGATSNTATLTVTATPVVVPPTVAKAFGDAGIPLNGTTSLTFAITNPNQTIELVNIGLIDLLPSGLVVASPNGLSGSCVISDGAAVVADPGSGSITMTTLSLPGVSSGVNSCSFSVNVTSTSLGVKNNVTGNITGTFDDGTGRSVAITGGAASASIAVLAPPAITKTFTPAQIAPNGVSTLSFTISNPSTNPIALTGVGFIDTLPANLLVATPSGAGGDCNGGTLTAVPGSGAISLTGGTIPASGSCTVSANVTSALTGVYVNTTTVTSTNGGTGNTASATLTVARPDLSITKTHKCDFSRRQQGAIYTITVSNSPTAGPTLGAVTVVDTLPDVEHTLVPTDISGTGWTCTLATLTCTRSDSLAPGASYPPIKLTVDVPQNIRANVVNTATVSGGSDLNNHTATDPTHIGPPQHGDDDHAFQSARDHQDDCDPCHNDDGHAPCDDHRADWLGHVIDWFTSIPEK